MEIILYDAVLRIIKKLRYPHARDEYNLPARFTKLIADCKTFPARERPFENVLENSHGRIHHGNKVINASEIANITSELAGITRRILYDILAACERFIQ